MKPNDTSAHGFGRAFLPGERVANFRNLVVDNFQKFFIEPWKMRNNGQGTSWSQGLIECLSRYGKTLYSLRTDRMITDRDRYGAFLQCTTAYFMSSSFSFRPPLIIWRCFSREIVNQSSSSMFFVPQVCLCAWESPDRGWRNFTTLESGGIVSPHTPHIISKTLTKTVYTCLIP